MNVSCSSTCTDKSIACSFNDINYCGYHIGDIGSSFIWLWRNRENRVSYGPYTGTSGKMDGETIILLAMFSPVLIFFNMDVCGGIVVTPL